MQAVKPGNVQSTINVTPLVDVVLVLLIIFMVLAPQLTAGPELDLPTTAEPPKKPENGNQILVALERSGTIWIDTQAVPADRFSTVMRDRAVEEREREVVIKGDAALTFGEVKNAMLAIEAAGFKNVGLIAERRDEQAAEPTPWR